MKQTYKNDNLNQGWLYTRFKGNVVRKPRDPTGIEPGTLEHTAVTLANTPLDLCKWIMT